MPGSRHAPRAAACGHPKEMLLSLADEEYAALNDQALGVRFTGRTEGPIRTEELMDSCDRLTIGRMVYNDLFSGTNRFSWRWLLRMLVARDARDELSLLSSFSKLALVEYPPYYLVRNFLR